MLTLCVQSLSSGSLGVFSMAGIIIGSLLGVLVLVGGGWNLLKLRRQVGVRCPVSAVSQ